MTQTALVTLTEEELDTLVSIAIRRAEVLEEMKAPSAVEASREVMAYEVRLAAMTHAGEVAGGVARVGAVRAALAAGERSEAKRLASVYCADEMLPAERRAAIERAFEEARTMK